MRLSRLDVERLVPCPVCKAKLGDPCRSMATGRIRISSHRHRRNDAREVVKK